MFCQNCGAKNDDTSIFCESCGAKLEKPADMVVEQNNTQENTAPEQNNVQPEQSVQPAQTEQSVQPVKPPKEKKPVSKVWIAVIAEVVVLAAAVVVFFNIGNDVHSPQKVAEKFFVEVANHNFKEAYKSLDVEESAFINEESFENAGCNRELDKVTNYKIKRSRGDELGMKIAIQYKTKGSASNHDYAVSVTKKTGKNALFFDKWEVSPEALIVKDFYLYVPEGAELTVDGVKLGKEYLSKNESDDETQVYVIPEMFAGEHQVVVNKEGMQEVRALVDTQRDYSYSLYSMSPDEKVLKELVDTAMQDVQTIYKAAAEGKEFKEVADLFSGDKKIQKSAKEDYEELVEDLTDSSYLVINKIAFSNLEGTVGESYQNSDSMEVYLQFDYVVDYTEELFGEVSNESYDSSDSMYLDLVNEDGKWLLTGFDDAYLYY